MHYVREYLGTNNIISINMFVFEDFIIIIMLLFYYYYFFEENYY